ncbi:MAG: hypothetical protein O7D34_03215 [Ignavibacteria bacterium]|nr:hypothetical protein [Ignavibacteria bacterium]
MKLVVFFALIVALPGCKQDEALLIDSKFDTSEKQRSQAYDSTPLNKYISTTANPLLDFQRVEMYFK